MMSPAEIHALLRTRFGAAIADFVQPSAGEPVLGIAPAALHDVCLFLRNTEETCFDFLRLITAVDWTDRFSSVYHLYSYNHYHSITLSVDLDRSNPCVCSVADIWPAANWHERESFDMMGIVYQGHPELSRILLPLDWEGHPLRKDYGAPEQYHGVKHE